MSSSLSAFTKWIGERIIWLTSILVVLVCADALLRYLFSTSKVWFTDLGWHVFALIFLLGGAYAMRADRHVRVDVFYSNWTARKKAWVDLLGTLCLLIPWTLIVIYTSFHYTENAFAIGERSAEPGGLGMRWMIKGAITLGFIFLLLQAVAIVLDAIAELRKPDGSI